MIRNFIFLGDSITQEGNWNELLPGKTILNFGVGGDTTYDILQRIDRLNKYPDHIVFLMAGINDLGNNRKPKQIISDYKEIVTRLIQPNSKREIVLFSVLPVSFQRSHHSAVSVDNILEVNNLIYNLSVNLEMIYINLFKLFADNNGNLQNVYSYDGLHLNSEGYKLWSNYLLEKYFD